MPVVPTEENRVGIAGVTGEKLVPGDFSGSGLDALGAGMQSLGETGQKVAVAQHEQAIEDDAAVKKAWNIYAEQSRAIRADFYARQGSDAASALQPATDALRETVDGLRDGLSGKRQRGIFDRSLPERLIADVANMEDHVATQTAVEQQKQSVGVLGNAKDDAVENAHNPEQFQRHVHTGIETMRTQALLQGRDPASVDHEAAHFVSSIHRDVADGLTAHDALAANQYLRDKGGEMIAAHRDEVKRSLAPVLGEAQAVADVDMHDALRSPTAPITPPGDIATVTGRMLTVETARQPDGEGANAATPSPGQADEKRDAVGSDVPRRAGNAARAAELSALMRHYRGDAAKAWAASLQGQAGVEALVAKHGDAWFGALPEDVRKAVAANMTLLGAATSPRTPPAPEDHAPASSWIQAQDWKDDRKQLAHEELHKRVGLANRQRSAAQDAAKETGLALAQKLGPGFISVNQLPPAVRRDLSDDALAALTLRADRNVHPVTVAPHGDVATTLNRMAATDPEGFAREDLRLVRDRMTPGEYASLERTQKGLASYPPAPATITQRHLWDEIRRNGLDDTTEAAATPSTSDVGKNVDSVAPAAQATPPNVVDGNGDLAQKKNISDTQQENAPQVDDIVVSGHRLVPRTNPRGARVKAAPRPPARAQGAVKRQSKAPPSDATPYRRSDGSNFIDERTGQPMLIPTGVSIKNTVRFAKQVGPFPFNRRAAASIIFSPGGVYDFQRTKSKLLDPSGVVKIDKRFIAIGNYNFGVYAAAAGMSLAEAQTGASAVYHRSFLKELFTGWKDWSGPSYNNAINGRQIKQGYEDYINHKIGN